MFQLTAFAAQRLTWCAPRSGFAAKTHAPNRGAESQTDRGASQMKAFRWRALLTALAAVSVAGAVLTASSVAATHASKATTITFWHTMNEQETVTLRRS